MYPVLITLSQKTLKEGKNSSLMSYSFIADFGGGVQKVLNRKAKVINSLIKDEDGTILSKDTCTLYHKDWVNMPVLGKWNEDYKNLK